jgi:DNA-binding CsgD family transcriptional regulator
MVGFGGPHRHIGLAAMATGDLPAARAHSEEALRLAHELGVPSIECPVRVNLAVVHFLAGDWDAAEVELGTAVALGRRSMSARSLATALIWQAFVRIHRGGAVSARACLTEAEQIYPSGADRHVASDLEVVRATLDSMTGARPAALPADIPVTGARYSLAFPLLGAARLAGGDRTGTRIVIERLRSCPGSPLLPGAFADRLAGLLTGDDTVLASAQRVFEELGLPFETARVALERSELVLDIRGVTAALVVFDGLGAKPWGDRARRLLRRQGIRTAPVAGAGGALSAREVEVAQLVAVGLSNAEIAERLYLSVRTVETHLRKVYARLGLGSRVALAQWVVAHSRT